MSCVVLIPVYKNKLDPDEQLNIKHSLSNLVNIDCVVSWLAPYGIDKDFYDSNFKGISWSFHPADYFRSIQDYSRLLLTDRFYETYHEHEWMLILQPDALILKPTLTDWLDIPFDYVGAPWPSGWEYPLPVRRKDNIVNVTCRAFVGNGGLSLRRSKKVVALLDEFPEASQAWLQIGNPEDLLISMLATISSFFLIPNIRVASQFSIELDYPMLKMLNQGREPFGAHGPLVKELSRTRRFG